jgi:hypothetical protein
MHERHTEDAAVLAQIGRALFAQPTRVKVRLPRALADLAVAAWARDEHATRPEDSAKQITARHRAGTLALIGRSVQHSGTPDGADIVVDLDAWFIGSAFDAADDDGLLAGLHPPA